MISKPEVVNFCTFVVVVVNKDCILKQLHTCFSCKTVLPLSSHTALCFLVAFLYVHIVTIVKKVISCTSVQEGWQSSLYFSITESHRTLDTGYCVNAALQTKNSH